MCVRTSEGMFGCEFWCSSECVNVCLCVDLCVISLSAKKDGMTQNDSSQSVNLVSDSIRVCVCSVQTQTV